VDGKNLVKIAIHNPQTTWFFTTC